MGTLLRLAVAVVALVIAGCAGVSTAAVGPAPPEREASAPPQAPAGFRLVGVGRLALVVREDLAVTALDLGNRRGQRAARWAQHDIGIAGVEVRVGRFYCTSLVDCIVDIGSAPVYVVVPGEDLVLELAGAWPDPAEVTTQLLPSGWTSVPFVAGRASYFQWARAVGAAGLVPWVHDLCDDLGFCVGASGVVRRVSPGPGTVLPAGARVDVGVPLARLAE